MYEFEFCLNRDYAEELHDYLALHSAKVQKKMLTLSVSLSVMLAALSLLIFKVTAAGLVCAAVCAALVFWLFPKLYWRIVFRRIRAIIDSKPIQFHPTKLRFDDRLYVRDGADQYSVGLRDIAAFDFTKNGCLIFYTRNGARCSIIIPNEVIGRQLGAFSAYLREVTAHEQG